MDTAEETEEEAGSDVDSAGNVKKKVQNKHLGFLQGWFSYLSFLSI